MRYNHQNERNKHFKPFNRFQIKMMLLKKSHKYLKKTWKKNPYNGNWEVEFYTFYAPDPFLVRKRKRNIKRWDKEVELRKKKYAKMLEKRKKIRAKARVKRNKIKEKKEIKKVLLWQKKIYNEYINKDRRLIEKEEKKKEKIKRKKEEESTPDYKLWKYWNRKIKNIETDIKVKYRFVKNPDIVEDMDGILWRLPNYINGKIYGTIQLKPYSGLLHLPGEKTIRYKELIQGKYLSEEILNTKQLLDKIKIKIKPNYEPTRSVRK